MFIWKFIIMPGTWREIGEGLTVSGYVTAAVAETAEDAKAHLKRYAAHNGLDGRWLDVADVIQLPLDDGTVVSWAQG